MKLHLFYSQKYFKSLSNIVNNKMFMMKVIAHILMVHKIAMNVSQTVICTRPQEKSLKQNEARSTQTTAPCRGERAKELSRLN